MQCFYWSITSHDRNAIERCARSGPKKLTKTYNKGFPNHSTLINYGSHNHDIGRSFTSLIVKML